MRFLGILGLLIKSSDFYGNWLPGPELIRTFLPISIFCSIAHCRKRRFYRLCYGSAPTHAQLSLHQPSPSHDTIEQRARRFQSMLDSGKANNRADLARLLGRVWELAERNRFFYWPLEFPEVFDQGGFDAVLSNPP